MKDEKTSFKIFIVFIFSIFLTSDKGFFRFNSITLSNIVAVLIICYDFFRLLNNKLVINKNKSLRLFFWFMIGALISIFFVTFICPITTTDNIYAYSWATGFNNPNIRGFVFLGRLFFSYWTVRFIYSTISDIFTLKKAICIFIYIYGIFTLFAFLQIIMAFLGIYVGQVFDVQHRFMFRIGAWVGEPSVLGSIILSGYFLLLELRKKSNPLNIGIKKIYLHIFFITASIVLFYTFSTSIFVSMLLVYFIFKRRNNLIITVFLLSSLIFIPTINDIIISKLINELSSLNLRSITWVIAFFIIKDNFIFGVGLGRSPFYNGTYVSRIEGINIDLLNAFGFDKMRHPPMNSYLEIISETGIIGFLFIIMLLYYFWCDMRRNKTDQLKEFIINSFGCTFLAYLFSSNSYPGFFYTSYFSFTFSMFLVGIKISESKKNNDILNQKNDLPK